LEALVDVSLIITRDLDKKTCDQSPSIMNNALSHLLYPIDRSIQTHIQEPLIWKRPLDIENENAGNGSENAAKRFKLDQGQSQSEKVPNSVPTVGSIAKLKVANLLSDTQEDSIIPPHFQTFYPQKEKEAKRSSSPDVDVQEPRNELAVVPLKFDKNNAKHVEFENLNVASPVIVSGEYEAIKVQEITLPTGGPRLTKIQSMTLECSSLQFLELFSCKQLLSFTEVKLPQLRVVRLLMVNRLSNQGLSQLLTCSEKIEQVFLMDLQNVTTVIIPSTLKNFRTLDIYECKTIETLQILTPSIQELTISDGRGISSFQISDPVMGLRNLRELKISGCPRLPLSFLYGIAIQNLRKLELASNAPSAKAYMKVEEAGFDTFVETNCNLLEELTLDKINNISLNTILRLVDQCKSTLVNVVFDLTSVEKPKVREALRHCDNLKDWKVEKWYIKKKWTEW